VLNVPSLAAHLWIGIPVVVALSLLLAAPIAWFIAPRLRARYWRRREEAEIRRMSATRLPADPSKAAPTLASQTTCGQGRRSPQGDARSRNGARFLTTATLVAFGRFQP
jgi:hypothetical protein